ncbi:helix-turn-helix domain-containing protein [Bradyrhizobium sp. dw_78]|uniref:helix-turn-helix domain-containing protein n=1 Tax=Bradyrhizobium sp. dw_78 TaxID=2719793 RepID=UPI001BD40FF7|nr:helix-turn-helix domain-containing protein [Bradyrhizobium sp. dw_78]
MLNAALSTSTSRHPVPASIKCGSPEPRSPLSLMGAPMRYPRNTEIFGEDEPAEYLYQVVSGAVRTYKMLDDGRRQVSAFYLPGDVFGFEAGETHATSAEAISDSQILVIKRSALMARADHEKDLAQQLWTLTARELERTQRHVLLLIKRAEERVAGFLLDMERRAAKAKAVELAMSRQDIADYLGLTIETVSRTLTQLQQTGVISLSSSRCVELRNRTALAQLNA